MERSKRGGAARGTCDAGDVALDASDAVLARSKLCDKVLGRGLAPIPRHAGGALSSRWNLGRPPKHTASDFRFGPKRTASDSPPANPLVNLNLELTIEFSRNTIVEIFFRSLRLSQNYA